MNLPKQGKETRNECYICGRLVPTDSFHIVYVNDKLAHSVCWQSFSEDTSNYRPFDFTEED